MLIPRFWSNLSGEGKRPDGSSLPVSVWGWGDDEASARSRGEERLQRVLERLRKGEPFPDQYDYGRLPLREETLDVHSGEDGQPAVIVTRNRYGARVLNAASVLFLDIDIPRPTLLQRLLGMFGRRDRDAEVLSRLKQTLAQAAHGTFRIYRTAAGYRVIGIDREYDPAGSEAQALMQRTGTDPAFARLCKAQRSFRARLTPKPWRCDLSLPPTRFPRLSEEHEAAFAAWLRDYENDTRGYATCRYLETLGSASARGIIKQVVELHDSATRSTEPLPLA